MSRHRKKGGIPDRWLDYSAVGQRLIGTRFIAFKVPLKQALNRQLSRSDVFGFPELLEKMKKQNQQLGLIIDLTFTHRYYDLQDVPDWLTVVKLKTAGHAVPSDDVILSFKRSVHRFIRENTDNDRLIGVHCTHGLNRTGYLICRYLIDVDHMDPDHVVTLFQSSRGHSIERMNYLKDLRGSAGRSNRGMEEGGVEPRRGQQGEEPHCHRLPSHHLPDPAHRLQPYQWRAVRREPLPHYQHPVDQYSHYQHPQNQNPHYQHPQNQNPHYQHPVDQYSHYQHHIPPRWSRRDGPPVRGGTADGGGPRSSSDAVWWEWSAGGAAGGH